MLKLEIIQEEDNYIYEDLMENIQAQIVFFHNRYNYGNNYEFNSDDYSGWRELHDAIMTKYPNVKIKPLYMLDHSQITLSTSKFNNPWDSGQVGYIFTEDHNIYLDYQVKYLEAIINGDVYKYVIIDEKTCSCCGETHDEIVDECTGFVSVNGYLQTVKDMRASASADHEYLFEKEMFHLL